MIPGAAEDSVLCSFTPTPRRVTASVQAWLVWMLSRGPERFFQSKSALTFSSDLAVGVLWTQSLCWLFLLCFPVYWFMHLLLRPPLFFCLENP